MTTLTPDVLKLDEPSEAAGIGESVRGALNTRLRRRGVVLGLPSASSRVNHFYLVAQKPDREMVEARLGLSAYLQLLLACNFNQRERKNLEYVHADPLNYAVIGTPNQLEYDQALLVKNADGAADTKSIAHLYKTRVYQLSIYRNMPRVIQNSTGTTDSYSLDQSQDEFYSALPFQDMDLGLWSENHGVPTQKFARTLGISLDKADAVSSEIQAKRRTTGYQWA